MKFEKGNSFWKHPNAIKTQFKKGIHSSPQYEFKKGHITSDETRKKLSLACQGSNNPNYGKTPNKETRIKIGSANRGKPRSEETKRKISLGNKGKIISKETRQKIGLSHIGKTTWIKVKHQTEEVKLKISKSHIGKKLSKNHIQQIKERRMKQIFPLKDSKPEIKIQNFLRQLNIDFLTHQYMNIEHGYQCDILIPSINLIVECDGNYWHKYPIGRDIDHIRTKELLENGFKVLRLWEHEINVINIEQFKERLEKANNNELSTASK